jgi:hypothetical protein
MELIRGILVKMFLRTRKLYLNFFVKFIFIPNGDYQSINISLFEIILEVYPSLDLLISTFLLELACMVFQI